ncbi:hypothetical protein O1C43_003593 [Vibrio cholerae]|uniref:hypothetical protein n=1 Tax=Vibrio cholerae TaxID=666 RepID=UPI001D938F44|nr:hypothetical protein [Vibrio cholerae]EGQ9189653.1 hypothetical protein [Vibrio cholerae]EKF9603744.1 hypothetical protein [Vibrio cholerae]MDY7588612.1 hypothetical protein [Vibrio cholerae]
MRLAAQSIAPSTGASITNASDSTHNPPLEVRLVSHPKSHDLTADDGKKIRLYDLESKFGSPVNGKIATEVTEKHSKEPLAPGRAKLKDGALSLDNPRFRQPDGQRTKTQEILRSGKDFTALIANSDNELGQLDKDAKLRMINDPARRAFESYYAKFAIEDTFSNNNGLMADRLQQHSRDQASYIKTLLPKDVLEVFEQAFRGNYDNIIKNGKEVFVGARQLAGFAQRVDKMISELDVPKERWAQIKEIYQNRYLDYTLKNDPIVSKRLAEDHWDGMFDSVKAPGKGRIELSVKEGNLFRVQDSHAMGILRSHDASPSDLRAQYDIEYKQDYDGLLGAGENTRCPDRLEIQDPEHKDAQQADSFMSALFRSGTGTYVNGPSGSIMIQHGAARACKDIHQQRSAEDIGRFIELQGLMFILFDGGHSMDEIRYPLNTEAAQLRMKKDFGNRQGFESIGKRFFTNPGILEKSAKATATFSNALLIKDALHGDIVAKQKRL